MTRPSPREISRLRARADWVRKETLKIHRVAPESRLASSLSMVEILVSLFYGGCLQFDPLRPDWDRRDRLVISKGHGAIPLYPILADLGCLDHRELENVARDGSRLGSIPDPTVPGFETINGSLGHGLGVAAGMALALRKKGRPEKVFALVGDGELFEGAVWEAVMFAGFHRLENLILIVDWNRACMLDFCRKVIDLRPLGEKFRAFGWKSLEADGHDLAELSRGLKQARRDPVKKPRVLIAETVKGKGIPALERDPLSHIRSLSPEEVERALEKL